MTTARLPAAADAVGAGGGGSPLEQRMRRALAWYPPEWRARHGEVMLGVLLEVAEAERMPGPSLPQRLNLAAHGLWQQLTGPGVAPLRARAAASALFGASAFALFDLVVFWWQPWAAFPPGILPSPPAWPGLAWLVGAVLLLCGWQRAARLVLAATGAGALLLTLVIDPGTSYDPYFAISVGTPAWHTTMGVFVVAAVFALSGAIRTPRRPGLAVLATLSSAGAIYLLYGLGSFQQLGFQLGQQARHLAAWDESLLWDAMGTRAQEMPAFVLLAAAAVIWAVARLGGRARAAGLSATMLPWLAFWVFHVVHDVLLGDGGSVMWWDGGLANGGYVDGSMPLSAPTRLVLAGILAIGCLATAVVGARAIAHARAEASAGSETPQPRNPDAALA